MAWPTYEILTNHKPFPGETPAEILAAQLDDAGPVPPGNIIREFRPRWKKPFSRASPATPTSVIPS